MGKLVSLFIKFFVAEIYIIPLMVTGIFYNAYLAISIPMLATGIVKAMPNPSYVLFPVFLILLYVVHRIKAKFLIVAEPGEMVWKISDGKVVDASRKYIWKFNGEAECYGVYPIFQGNKIVISGSIPYTVSDTQLIIPYTVTLPFKMDQNRYQEIFDVFKSNAADGRIDIESVVRGFVERHAESRLSQISNEERNDVKKVLREVLAVPDQLKELVCFGECQLKYKNPDQGLVLEFTTGETAQSQAAQEPEAQEPEAPEPEAPEPEAPEPEVQEPEAQEPEAQEPEAQEPEAQEPEAQEPEAQEPEAQEPEAQEPEAQEPEAQEPEAQESKARGQGPEDP